MSKSAVLSSVTLLVVAVFGGLYFAQPNPLAATVKDLEGRLNQAQGENTRLKVDNEKLQVAVKKAEQEAAKWRAPGGGGAVASRAGTGQSPGGGGGDGDDKEGAGGRAGTVSGLSTNGGVVTVDQARVRETMRRMNDSQMDVNYGRLFKHLGLNEEETARFKQLIADRLNQQNEIAMKYSDKNLTAEQKKGIGEELAASKKASDAAIRQFLDNDEDYATYQQWEDTKVDRMNLQSVVTNFDAADATLSTDQRDQLLALMIATRKASNAERIKVGQQQQQAGFGGVNGVREAIRAREAANNQAILRQAASFLTPEQLAILEKAQGQRLETFYRLTTPAPGAVSPAAPSVPGTNPGR